MRTRSKDFIAYEGPSLIDGSPIVAVVTGVEVPSRNVKTGRMLQTWILQQDMHPKEAVRTGQDTGICGTCPLKGLNGQLRTCYVRVENAPTNVWKKWKAEGEPVDRTPDDRDGDADPPSEEVDDSGEGDAES